MNGLFTSFQRAMSSFLLLAALPSPVFAGNPAGDREIEGWTLHINPALLTSENLAATERARELLKGQLQGIIRVVPAAAVAELRKIPLYFSPVYPDGSAGAEYHPGAEWLKEHGRDPVMAKGVEFSNIPMFEKECRRMPNLVLHELAHGYHDRVIGFDNPQVISCYEKARTSGGYDHVQRQDSEGNLSFDKAYAMSNHKEYFAETTEAWFGRNDFYPFDRAELQKHDPEMAKLLDQLWNNPKN